MSAARARVIVVAAAQLAAPEDHAAALVVRALLDEGVPVAARETVDESEVVLERTLELAVEDSALVVVLAAPAGSGGDIVRRVLARLAVARLVLNEPMLEALQAGHAARGLAMPRRLDRLALLPQGAELWPAPPGEPGWALAVRRSLVAVLPLGSPRLGALVDEHLRGIASEAAGTGPAAVLRTLRTAGLGLADAEERLGAWLGKDAAVAVSCVPADGEVWVRLLARAATRPHALGLLGGTEAAVRGALGADCYGRDHDSLAAAVGGLLLARGLTVSVAESGTAGAVAHQLAAPPGAARYFDLGVVVGARASLEERLGVPGALLRASGEVSAAVAEAMVRGACRAGGSPCGIAVTGVAGPEGDGGDVPAGTVFAAAAAPGGLEVRRLRFAGGREAVARQAAAGALDLLRRLLLR